MKAGEKDIFGLRNANTYPMATYSVKLTFLENLNIPLQLNARFLVTTTTAR